MTGVELQGRIIAVARTLDTIEVRGRKNCQLLAGCIDYLEKMAEEIGAADKGGVSHEDCEK